MLGRVEVAELQAEGTRTDNTSRRTVRACRDQGRRERKCARAIWPWLTLACSTRGSSVEALLQAHAAGGGGARSGEALLRRGKVMEL